MAHPIPVADATHKSKFSEKTTIGVLSKLKNAYEIIRRKDEQINLAIHLVEKMVVKMDDESSRSLLLDTLSAYSRAKQVVSYEIIKTEYNDDTAEYEPVLDNKGQPVWEKDGVVLNIRNDKDWVVSLIKDNTAVRVHLSEDRKKQLKVRYEKMKNVRKVVV